MLATAAATAWAEVARIKMALIEGYEIARHETADEPIIDLAGGVR